MNNALCTSDLLHTAASSNSLVEGKKEDFRAFTPPLQSSLVSRGRDSPLRKISRVKDPDEADIARAIRRIENTVSESIQRKTSSALELATSDSGNSCANSRKLGQRKMAMPEIEDFSSNVHENGGFQRQENDGGIASQEIIASKSESLDEDNKKCIENEVPVVNGDLDKELHAKHLMNDVENFAISENCINVVVTKKETGHQIAGEKKSQGTGKKQNDSKGTKPQSKSDSSVKSTTTTTKTQSKVDKKVASATKKPVAKSTTTPTTKPLPKHVTEKKTGTAGKASATKPIFKVSTSTSSTMSELRSVPSKAKPAPTGPKSAGTKPAVAKTTATTANGKHPPGKSKVSAAAKQTSAKSEEKNKKEAKKESDAKKAENEDSTDGAVLSTKGKVNGGTKVAAQSKSKSGAQTPKVSAPAKSGTAAPAKSATSAKAKSTKASDKIGSLNGVDKSKEKASGVSTAKTVSNDKVSSKTTPANKAEHSDSTMKQSAANGRSKKATTSNATKVSSSSAKGSESGKKPAAPSKPASAPPKTPSAAKSTKPPVKQSSSPPKSAPAASKAAKPAAKPSPSATASSVGKKPTAPKPKASRAALDRAEKVTHSKAAAAKSNKEVKTSKTPSDKSTKVEKKDNKKALKASADKKKEPKKDTGEMSVSKDTVIVEHKEKGTVDVVLPASENLVEESTRSLSEADAIKSPSEAVIVESVNAEHDLSAKTESRELTSTEEVLLDTDSEPSRLDSQIADIGLQQRNDSPNTEGIKISSEVSEAKVDEIESETESRLEQFDIQPEVEEQSVEVDSREDKGVGEQMEVSDDLSSQNIAEQRPSQIEAKVMKEEEGRASPYEINNSDIGEDERQEGMEDGRERISCEEEDDYTTKDDIEEQDRESAMFDESKLISLEEITAKCDEDDIREGAVAPTPPETPVPDNASAETSAALDLKVEMEYQSDMASDVSSVVEQIPSEISVMVSEMDDDSYNAKSVEMHQTNEISAAVTEQNVVPEENPLDDVVQKDDTGSEKPDELQEIETAYSGKEVSDAGNEVVATNRLDDDEEYCIREDDNNVEDIVQIEPSDIENAGEYSGHVIDLSMDTQDTLHDHKHDTFKDDTIESNESAALSRVIYEGATDSGEPLEIQDFNADQNNEVDSMSNVIEAASDIKAENVTMDKDLSEDTEMAGESEILLGKENLADNELLERTEKPEDIEASNGYEVAKIIDASQEVDLISTQAPGLICDSEKELVDDNVFESKEDESYYIGSKGTEELMQRESVEEENVGAAIHEADEPERAEVAVAVKVQMEPEDEEKEGENLEEDKDEFENESYGISVNEVTIDVNQGYDQEVGTSQDGHECSMPEGSVYDAVLVNSQMAEIEDMGAIIGEQGYSDNYTVGGDVMVTADAGQNEILNPDIGLQENGSEGEKTPNPEEDEDEETRSSGEDEDIRDVTLKPLDLKEQISDSAIAEDQFTPISDLPDDMRSPLAKDSFGHFVSGGDEEIEYQDGESDGEGDEFVSEAIEHAKESVRVAKSLDDSCEDEEVKSQTFGSEIAQRFDDNFEADDLGFASKDEVSSYQAPVAAQIISSPYISSDGESFEEKEIFEDDTSNQLPVDTIAGNKHLSLPLVIIYF